MHEIKLQPGKKIYFASDFHFGIPDYGTSRERERRVCQWLEEISDDAQTIFLLGDLFDSWMEYKRVVPKGTVRFLGKLAQLSDAGIEIIVFTGNHDVWMHGYFQKELNIKVFKTPQEYNINGRIFYLAHGDGLCKKESRYRIMKSIIQNPISQFLYRQLHPDLGLRMADYFSRLGPKHKYEELTMKGDNEEYQLIFANEYVKTHTVDYFVFGHRHIPAEINITMQTRFINLGDWISYNTYAIYDGNGVHLAKY